MMGIRRRATDFGWKLSSIVLLSASLAACGAQQGGRGSCPKVKEGLSAGQWQNWAECVHDGRVSSPDVCRSSLLYAQGMTPDAVEAATRCTLSAQVREDGALLGESLQRIQANSELVAGLARGIAPHYSHEIHGGRFASSISQSGEVALGAHLDQIEEASRNELIRTAFAWSLRLLSDAALPFIQDSSAWQAELQEMARRAMGARELSHSDQFSLVSTGMWSANDILDCAEGKNRACKDTDINAAARLLQHDQNSRRSSVGAARVLESLGNAQLENRSVELILSWLSQPTTPNGSAQLRALRTSLASTDASLAFRMRVAEGANEGLCDSVEFPDAAQYAVTVSSTPTEPWSIFLDRCLNVWRAEDLARAASVGYEINASDAQRARLHTRLQEELQQGSCAQVVALGDQVMSVRTTHHAKRGLVWSALQNARPDCAAELRPRLASTVADAQAHPEARLRAIAAAAQNGNREVCSQISSAQTWNEERTGLRLGRGVPAALSAAQQACR